MLTTDKRDKIDILAIFPIFAIMGAKEMIMSLAVTDQTEKSVPLTRFHNNTGEFLDLATRMPVVLTSHGRERHIIAEIGYFRHLEKVAKGQLLDAMDLQAVKTDEMSENDRAVLKVSRPSAKELADDKWQD